METRKTRQKAAIREVLVESDRPLLPKEIAQLAEKEVPGIGIATVYRSLKRLQEEGEVMLVEIPGKSPRYESAKKGHHHHFVCRQCGTVFDLEGCCGHFNELAPKGFTVEDHEVTLFGSCDQCG